MPELTEGRQRCCAGQPCSLRDITAECPETAPLWGMQSLRKCEYKVVSYLAAAMPSWTPHRELLHPLLLSPHAHDARHPDASSTILRSIKQYEGKLAALSAINDALRQENEQLHADLEDAALPRADAGEGAQRQVTAAGLN